MPYFDGRDRSNEFRAAAAGLLLVQMAASQAEIGPFAKRARETPQAAADLYRAATTLGRAKRLPA